ncbi:MAG: FkbM family methyltransferase [Candidatus Binataceae bacterium]
MKAKLKDLTKRVLSPFNLVLPTKVNGRRFKVPIMHGIGGSNLQMTELWMIDELRRLFSLASDSAFMDVGVNLGQTLLKVKSLAREIVYLGFEPNPFCVQFVNELIRVNDLPNCEVVPVGLSRESALVPFFAEREADATGSIIEDLTWHKQILRRQHIPVFAFDDIAPVIAPAKISIIKIDVEGAELEVITGMKKFLTAHRPFLTCEVLQAPTSAQLEMRHERNRRLIQLLVDHGYLAYRLLKNSEQSMVRGLERVERAESFGKEPWDPRTSPALCDYLFLPEESKDQTARAFAARAFA